MKPCDSLTIRLPVGATWNDFRDAFNAAQQITEGERSPAPEDPKIWRRARSVFVDGTKRPRRIAKASVVAPHAHMLGKMTDRELAKSIGCSAQAVHEYRRLSGIPAFKPAPLAPKPPKPPKPPKATPRLDAVRAWAAALGRPFSSAELYASACFPADSQRASKQSTLGRWVGQGIARHSAQSKRGACLYEMAPSPKENP